MLMGHRDFITVQISNENTQVQILHPELTGDKVISSAHSRFLIEKVGRDHGKIFQQLILLVILREKER